MDTSNKVVHYGSDTQLVAGLEKLLGQRGTIVLGGKTYTGTALAKRLQGRIDTAADVVQTRAEWKAALARHRAELRATRELLTLLKTGLRTHFHGVPGALDELGLAPRKARRQLTTEEKRVAAAKARATRAARHTMGKRQRKAIRGAPLLPLEGTSADAAAHASPAPDPPGPPKVILVEAYEVLGRSPVGPRVSRRIDASSGTPWLLAGGPGSARTWDP